MERGEHGESVLGFTGARATVVKKRWRKHSMRAVLGCGQKRTGAGGGAVEDGEANVMLTRAREAVRWLGDDDKAAAVEEPGGDGARARRGEEESGDGCGEDRARAPTFYRGQREVEALGTQSLASMPGLADVSYSE
jgi:hypothetical protein